MSDKKKLIEFAIPLDAINDASVAEKASHHGHPSTLHRWWARRPLATCRAILFSQLVDDPSEHISDLMADDTLRTRAQAKLDRLLSNPDFMDNQPGESLHSGAELTLEECVIALERERLFEIMRELVLWKNSTNADVMKRATAEIRRCYGDDLPSIHDPFSGGGSIPLEAQRLGLPAVGSDLNPLAVIIGKAMTEIPFRWRDHPPINPDSQSDLEFRNAEGLAEDVEYYGTLVLAQVIEEIGHHYPDVSLSSDDEGTPIIAWFWTRTVPSPDPAFSGAHVPIASTFQLSTRKSREAWVEPVVDRDLPSIRFNVVQGPPSSRFFEAEHGTKFERGTNFRCLLSGAPITADYISQMGSAGKIGRIPIAAVTSYGRKKHYICVDDEQAKAALAPHSVHRPDAPIDPGALGIGITKYGISTWGALFDDRQCLALNAFTGCIRRVKQQIMRDAKSVTRRHNGIPTLSRKQGDEYANDVLVYLSLVFSKCVDYWSTGCSWQKTRESIRSTFSDQTLSMKWDYVETNPFSGATGSWSSMLNWVRKAIIQFRPHSEVRVFQADAKTVEYTNSTIISTDPPYFDNIGYADISDFFFVWIRPLVKEIYPELTRGLAAPKSDELVATPSRHGGRSNAEQFFLSGMQQALSQMSMTSDKSAPITIYYAFKHSDTSHDDSGSRGWSTFLEAVIEAGYSIVGTWTVRTDLKNRMQGIGRNALGTTVVLVCRKREADAGTISTAEFIARLKKELPPAISRLQSANIAPADIPQAALGPGMAIFSRYRAVLGFDDSHLTVRTALQLINHELDEYLSGIQGVFDTETRFGIRWVEHVGLSSGDFTDAHAIAMPLGISVEKACSARIVHSEAGTVRIVNRNELDPDWIPNEEGAVTTWQCCQQLILALEVNGEDAAALLLRAMGPMRADSVKDLAYCLYNIFSEKPGDKSQAEAYSSLVAIWRDLTLRPAPPDSSPQSTDDSQIELNV